MKFKLAPIFWLIGSILFLLTTIANPIAAFASAFFIVGSILALAEK